MPLKQIVDGGPGKDGIPVLLPEPRFASASQTTSLHDGDGISDRSGTIRSDQPSSNTFVIDADCTPLPSIMAFSFARYAFHPVGQMFKNPEGTSP
ncbi:MAG: hypothetical protein ABS70_00155 [Nitrospira sp. SCN 59-13]|nr:MAG: hypothetical protein ABS70_00155 [Nitrospira sp. SCN 59-13]